MEQVMKVLKEKGIIDKIKKTMEETDKEYIKAHKENPTDDEKIKGIIYALDLEMILDRTIFNAIIKYAYETIAKEVYMEVQKENTNE